jgi:hypothetical protein
MTKKIIHKMNIGRKLAIGTAGVVAMGGVLLGGAAVYNTLSNNETTQTLPTNPTISNTSLTYVSATEILVGFNVSDSIEENEITRININVHDSSVSIRNQNVYTKTIEDENGINGAQEVTFDDISIQQNSDIVITFEYFTRSSQDPIVETTEPEFIQDGEIPPQVTNLEIESLSQTEKKLIFDVEDVVDGDNATKITIFVNKKGTEQTNDDIVNVIEDSRSILGHQEIYINNLEEDKDYELIVSVETTQGNNFSIVEDFNTRLVAPEVHNLDVTDVSKTSAKVSFDFEDSVRDE